MPSEERVIKEGYYSMSLPMLALLLVGSTSAVIVVGPCA